MTILIIVIAVIALPIIFGIFIYNKLVLMRNRMEEAWSDISVQLKRRYDLIPNLVNTVKGYAKHERETFEKVTQMRANAINASGVEGQAKAENMLSEALKSLFAVSENYPDLKANENFIQLQREITDTKTRYKLLEGSLTQLCKI